MKKIIQALKCADADLLGELQRAANGERLIEKHDIQAVKDTREEIAAALNLLNRRRFSIQTNPPQYRDMEKKMQQFVSERAVAKNMLPPDPEDMNDERAAWAAVGLTVFMGATGTDAEDACSDFLADLMHWCDRLGIDFKHELARAEQHHREETSRG